jgi:hypothetical protein
MYDQRIIHFPALGKSAELRAALEERNSAGNAAAPHALNVSMFALEPSYIHSIRFESLAAIEAYQEQLQGDSAFQAVSRKIMQCLSRPQAVLLLEDLINTEITAKPNFVIRNRICPAPGKGAELRALLEERAQKDRPPGLAGARLSRQVASVDGPAFVVTLYFAGMAGIDEVRSTNDQDSTFQPYIDRVASLSRTPFQQRMQRVLMNFGPGAFRR